MPHAAFGHGLHETESRLAARLILRLRERAAVRAALLHRLPQPSPATRERLADKLLQRLWGETPAAVAGLRLLADLTDGRARRQLLLHRLAAVDTLVGALAREVFLPLAVRGALPAGLRPAPAARSSDLRLPGLGEPPQTTPLSTDSLLAHARRAWRAQPATTLRALHILRQCGVLARVPHAGDHRGAYLPSGAPPALAVSAFLLHEEALWPGGERPLRSVLQAPLFALFLVKPPLPEALLAEAADAGLVRVRGPRVTTTWREPGALVERLLAS